MVSKAGSNSASNVAQLFFFSGVAKPVYDFSAQVKFGILISLSDLAKLFK